MLPVCGKFVICCKIVGVSKHYRSIVFYSVERLLVTQRRHAGLWNYSSSCYGYFNKDKQKRYSNHKSYLIQKRILEK